MPLNYWTTSTGRQVDFFDGAYEIDYITPCDPNRHEVIVYEPTALPDNPAGQNLFQLFSIGTSSQREDLFTRKVRTACHVMLEQIPAHGLPELVESLKNIFNFYKSRPTIRINQLEPPRHEIGGHLTTTSTRPPFTISEE